MKFKLAIAALLASTAIASAADLPARTYTKAPPMVSPAYNWSGFYAGVMGGYAWSDQSDIAGVVLAGSDLQGGFGGGTIGYNWQTAPNWLFGIEVDAAAADISYTETALFGSFEDKIRAMGSVTGRLGYVWGPGMLYVKGGYAWADNRVNLTLLGVSTSDSQVHSGWTIGGGVEYMFAPSWSVKAEYMYADFDSQTYFGLLDLGTSVHTVKGGINYHFNWGAPAAY